MTDRHDEPREQEPFACTTCGKGLGDPCECYLSKPQPDEVKPCAGGVHACFLSGCPTCAKYQPQPDEATVERVRQVLREHGWMLRREDYPTIRAAIAAMRKEQP